ncbi:MAG TPA: hypothetical protein VGM64_12990 [Lacunisphaera sp.]
MSEKIASLRHLLASRFPTLPRRAGRVLASGIPAIDAARGGLPLGGVTEIVAHSPSSGAQLVLSQLLSITRAQRQRVVLIDTTDCFDPASLPEDHLVHLLWVRCQNTTQAVQATDLLARDANLSLVCLDLRDAPAVDLRRIPGSQWYRLQRATEPADLALLVLTPHACVPSAEVRFLLPHSHTLTTMNEERPILAAGLHATLDRQRRAMANAS